MLHISDSSATNQTKPMPSIPVRTQQPVLRAKRAGRVLMSAHLYRSTTAMSTGMYSQCRMCTGEGLCELEVCGPVRWHLRFECQLSSAQS